jgi:acetyl esterase/lipase
MSSENAGLAGSEPDAVEVTDVPWRDDLLARIYTPPAGTRGEGRGAGVVDVHGGAWATQDRTLGVRYCVAAARAGFTVVAVDFRDGRTARHPAASDDVAAAVRWVREHADDWALDPDRVALMGSSSGGHLALLAALTGVRVPFAAAFWPPVDPLARYRYARDRVDLPVPDGQSFDAARLVASTEAYFPHEAAMAEASIASVVREGRAGQLPAVWLVHAGDDLNVPRPMIDELVECYRAAGGQLELSEYPGEAHGFGHGRGPGAERFRTDLVERLAKALC